MVVYHLPRVIFKDQQHRIFSEAVAKNPGEGKQTRLREPDIAKLFFEPVSQNHRKDLRACFRMNLAACAHQGSFTKMLHISGLRTGHLQS